MKSLPILAALLVVGCNPPNAVRVSQETSTLVSDAEIYTVTHDGHKFVVWDGYKSGAMLHHPSCDCLKTEVKP